MNRRDLTAAVVILCAAGLLSFEALRLDLGNLERPGPGFMPLVLGLGLIGLSAIYLSLALAHRNVRPPSWERTRWKGPLMATAAVVAYGVLLVPVGFALSTAVFIAFWVAVIAKRRVQSGLVYAVLATGGLLAIFAWGLRLRLPPGPIGG
jgi:hypothetical protein